MFTQRQTYLEKALLSAVAVLLVLTTAGQSAKVTGDLQTTATPALSDSALTTQLDNSTMEEPRVLHSHKPCGSKDESYCLHSGECMYPQDSDKAFCKCKLGYSGTRCEFESLIPNSSITNNLPEIEQLIGIIFGVIMLISVLAMITYCFIYKRCIKSAPQIKSAQSAALV